MPNPACFPQLALFLALLLVLGTAPLAAARAATPANATHTPQLRPLADITLQTNIARRTRNVRAMGVLLGWSGANIAAGAVGMARTEGSTYHFHEMNLAWNAVNTAIGGLGLWGALGEDPASFDPVASLEEGRKLEKVLLLNAGLDLAYIAAGAWMWERGLARNDARLEGYGPSLMVQGGFLLVFDVVLAALQARASGHYAEQLRVGLGQVGGAF